MTGFVSSATDFGTKTSLKEVLELGLKFGLVMKIKPFAQIAPGTKVIGRFGPANADIYPDCVIRDQNKFKTEPYEGKIEMRKQKGFSLIELLIVVAIILIIAAIAIPNLMRAKMAANDSSAAASERSIVTGEIGYFAAYPTIGFTNLLALGGANGAQCVPGTATACMIDSNLANNGTPPGSGKSGYLFVSTQSTGAGSPVPNQFLTTATPISVTTGSKAYCATDDGVVRTQPAGTITIVASYIACQGLNPLAN